MAKFLYNFTLFLLPLIVLVGFPMYVFLKSGEAVSYAEVARIYGRGDPVLFGRAYSDVDENFKILSARERKADVLVLGSSRVMYIRSQFFRDGVSFFNGGGAARHPDGFLRSLQQLPEEAYPKIIIAGIDQRWMLPGYVAPREVFGMDEDPAWDQFFAYAWKKMYVDYFSGKFTLRQLGSNTNGEIRVGLTAVATGSGFRSDGSYYSREFIEDVDGEAKVKNAIAESITAITPGQYNFDYAARLNEGSLKSIEAFLALAEKNNIAVVGYLSPYSGSIYRKLQGVESPDKEAITRLHETFKQMFSAHGFAFYDLSDAGSFGGEDEEFLDPWHGGDKAFAKAFLLLAEKNRLINSIMDAGRLEGAIVASKDPHTVF